MLADLLDRLEARYGAPSHEGPTEPFRLLVWLNCGYPASDAACARGFAAVEAAIGVTPGAILAADTATLTDALRAGGMIAEQRAERLKVIARRVSEEFGGDLAAALTGPVEASRRRLTSFPTIGEAAADRILLFWGLAPVAVAPAGALQVPLRLGYGVEVNDWGKTYRSVRDALEAELPAEFAPRQRAYLLLKTHGQATCKRAAPVCRECPLTDDCRYFQQVVAPAALSPG